MNKKKLKKLLKRLKFDINNLQETVSTLTHDRAELKAKNTVLLYTLKQYQQSDLSDELTRLSDLNTDIKNTMLRYDTVASYLQSVVNQVNKDKTKVSKWKPRIKATTIEVTDL